MSDALRDKARAAYERAFGAAPGALAFAPGRVNLLGEHTDYNGGVVLPMPLKLGTAVAIGAGGEDGTLSVCSEAFDAVEVRQLDETPRDTWTDYVLGALRYLLGDALTGGIRVAIAADLPMGSGLSSSASLEVATMRAAGELHALKLDPVDTAVLARKVENEFIGVPCGIMDQFSVSVGTPGDAIFLDTRTLGYAAAAIPESHAIIVVHSGHTHKLSENGYETRVRECNAAAAALRVEMLSDLSLDDLSRIDALKAPLNARARHIVTENARVHRAVYALDSGDLSLFARLIDESHSSQRDDYEVSIPEIDALVEGARDAGAIGARLTGGGFGGSIVALTLADEAQDIANRIDAAFPEARVLAIT